MLAGYNRAAVRVWIGSRAVCQADLADISLAEMNIISVALGLEALNG